MQSLAVPEAVTGELSVCTEPFSKKAHTRAHTHARKGDPVHTRFWHHSSSLNAAL